MKIFFIRGLRRVQIQSLCGISKVGALNKWSVEVDLTGKAVVQLTVRESSLVHEVLLQALLLLLFKGGFKFSLGTLEWCRSSYSTDLDISEIVSPVSLAHENLLKEAVHSEELA